MGQRRSPSNLNATSGLDHVASLLGEARTALEELVDASSIRYQDINAGGGGAFFIGWNKWQWEPLPAHAQPLVGRARQAVERLGDFAAQAVARAAPERQGRLDQLDDLFRRVIEQPNGSHPNGAVGKNLDEVRMRVAKAVDDYETVVQGLPTAHGSGERLVVADTSALLDRPDLQDWVLDGQAWSLILLPQVLAEIDDRKRDDRTREAAQKLIRQFDEFDRRGNTLEGVPLAGKLRYREVPTSADMSRTLQWLRVDVPDDVIIAGALELIWADLTVRVMVAASDRNVRNKARLAGLGVVRPEDLIP